MGPTVLAEVSCSSDEAHLGYVVGEGPALKTGYGKSQEHYYSKYGPIHNDYYSKNNPGIKYVINSCSLQFIPLRLLSEQELTDYFPEKPKNVIHYHPIKIKK